MGEGQDQTILSLIHAAKYREAYQLAEAAGVRERWTEGENANLYGRLIRGLGARREASVLHWRAYRRDRGAGGLALQVGSHIHSRRGPLEGWNFYETQCNERREAMSDAEYGELLAQMAFVAACWRDFDKAESLLDDAAKAAPNSTWVMVQRASVAHQMDDHARTTELIDAVLEQRPYYRPATEWKADLLTDVNRNDDALAYIDEALEHVDSPSLAAIASSIHSERGDHAEALAAIDRYEALSPLADKDVKKWIAGRRADLHYLNGSPELVPAFAEASDNKVLKEIAAKLKEKEGEPIRRVRLPVPYIQQHHNTCAPATMASICAFWERPAEHLEIVEAICYDGTPGASERGWAEEQGFVAREFRVDWDSLRELCDRGIPFTLTTTEPTSAHLQAVIGYDATAETIIIRDPNYSHYSEAVAEAFLKRYEGHGPRGFLFLPKEEAHRLDGLDELPDEAFFNLAYELERALQKHDRQAAGAAADELAKLDPQHRLTHEARVSLAAYDGDDRALLTATEALCELFPKNGALKLRRFNAMQRLSLIAEQKPLAEEAVRGKKTHPVFFTVHANLIADDARRADEASYYYRKAIRRSSDAQTYRRLGHVYWGSGDLDRATELYRIAATMAHTDESLADTYFSASRHVGGTDGALAYLRKRFEELGAKNAGPAITLAEAYQRMSREPDAIAVVEEGLEKLPDDGDLLLFAASCHQRTGNLDKAEEVLAKAEGKIDRVRWLRRAAPLAQLRGDHEKRAKCWREVLESDPLAIDAHRALASLAAQTGAVDADVAYFAEQCREHPFYRPLHCEYLSALRYEKRRDEALEAAAHLLELNPDHHWARRERIILFTELDRFDDAKPDIAELMRRDPEDATSHGVVGAFYADAGDRAKSDEHFRRSIELDVDYDYGIRNYVFAGVDHADKRERVAFVQAELERQPIFGDGIVAFRDVAATVLSPEEIAAVYGEIAEARPDLWQIWSVRITDLAEREEIAKALELAEQATERFPLLPRLWSDLANVHRLNGDVAERVTSLRRAIELSPGWSWARRELGIALDDLGEREEAIEVLERCVADAPLDPPNHTVLADLQKLAGQDEAALASVRRAVELDPSFDWAWTKWLEWSDGDEATRAEIIAAGEKRVERAPEDTNGWSFLARLRSIEGGDEAACETLREGIEKNPDSEWLRISLARRLFSLGRFGEARATCTEDLPEGPGQRRLLHQAAQIDWDCGKRKEAMEAMEALLEKHADYAEGVALLADWYCEEEKNAKYEEWARRLVELQPAAARSHGYLGDALILQNRKPEAALSLERAFQLDPEYRFGAERSLEIRIDAEQFDQAKTTLARLDHLAPDPRNLVFALQIAFGEKRFDDGMALFGKIVRADSTDWWVVEQAVKALPDRKWKDASIVDLETALTAGEVRNPRAGIAFVDYHMNRGKRRKLADRIAELPLDPDVATHTWHYYITRIGDEKRLFLLRWLVFRHRERLRTNTHRWGSVGYALFEHGRYRDCAKWMADWRERDELLPWMLWNYGLAAAAEKPDYAELRAVSEHAVHKLDRNRSTSSHVAGLAFYDAIEGRLEDARGRMDGINETELGAAWHFCCELARASIALELDRDAAAAGHHLREARKVNANWFEDPWSRRHWRDWLKANRKSLKGERSLRQDIKTLRKECSKGAREDGEYPLTITRWPLLIGIAVVIFVVTIVVGVIVNLLQS